MCEENRTFLTTIFQRASIYTVRSTLAFYQSLGIIIAFDVRAGRVKHALIGNLIVRETFIYHYREIIVLRISDFEIIPNPPGPNELRTYLL